MEKFYDKPLNISLRNERQCKAIFKALNNKTRRDILRLLSKKGPLSIQSISFNLDLPLSTISEHVSILLKSGVISSFKKNSERGQTKIVFRQYDKIDISLNDYADNLIETDNTIMEIPIGSYSGFDIHQLCGMVCNEGYIGSRDSSLCFHHSERFKAQLIWFDYGYLEYKIPLDCLTKKEIFSFSFSLELCSEAPGYNENWKSDIFFEINDQEIGYFTSQGDYGRRRGKLTPSWWSGDVTSYGVLKQIEVNEDGSFIDGIKVSDITIYDLNIEANKVLKLRFGVKENAKNRGGLNLFGDSFGDYPQHIILIISYR